MYKALLFDADGTLLDFKKSEKIGLEMIFCERNVSFTEAMRQYYITLNDKLWKDFEQGKISKNYIMEVRFQMLFDKFNIKQEGQVFEAAYRQQLNQGSHTIEGAISICQSLHAKYPLYIVSNGVSRTQYKRLQASGLNHYFQDIFVSEDIGFQKPDIAYFEYVLDHVQATRDEILVIGDSLTSDIQGANNAGIDSCWFNPNHYDNHSNSIPTYEIGRLEQLWKIL